MNILARDLPPLKISNWLIFFLFICVMFDIRDNRINAVYLFFTVYFSLYIHELAHSIIGKCFGYVTEYISLDITHGLCKFKDLKWLENPRPQFYISVAGPLSNLILAAILLPIDSTASYLNVIFGCFNLIPMMPLDGGHMLWAILKKYTKEHVYILHTISTLVGIYAMYFFRKDYIVLVVLFLFTLANAIQSTRSQDE